MKNRLLYIHGFNSSSRSEKALTTQNYIADKQIDLVFHCPQIKSSPNGAIAQLEDIIQTNPDDNWCFVGSSLGGYFSTYLAEKYKKKAVLINPAVRPFELLKDYIGPQVNPYTNEHYEVTTTHMEELKALYQNKISSELYYVMVQTEDEVLDYRQAQMQFKNSKLEVQQGGDHSFINYEAMLPSIMSFLLQKAPST